MQTVKATFRITTPMFLCGTDQKRAELRVPSVKGALRFWWRALAFGRHGNNIKAIRAEEARLFGGTEPNEGQSKIMLRLSETSVEPKMQRRWNPSSWEAYVGYGLIETIEGQQRNYLKAGGRFELELRTRPNRGQKDAVSDIEKQQLQTALRALGLLGGLGGRSRKGWGSVQLESLIGLSKEWNAPDTVDSLRSELTLLFSDHRNPMPDYTAFHSQACFALGPLQADATAAHRFLAERYKEAIRAIDSKCGEREQFGLPRKNAGRNADQRRSSPLFLHIHELSDGSAVPLAAFLPAHFLSQQDEPTGKWRHIEPFLNKVRSEEGNNL
jgi:CRISPR-associated protein Cmr1